MRPTHFAAASILAFAVQGTLAQTATTDKDATAPSSPQTMTPAPAAPSGTSAATGAATQAPRASHLIGLNIRNADGDDIGEIKDLTVDANTGQVQQVVVGVGGFLGIGQKDVALNWSDLKIHYDPPQTAMPGTTADRGTAAPPAGTPASRDRTAAMPSAPASGMSADRRDAAMHPGGLRLTVNMTKDQLQNAPEFKRDDMRVRSGPPPATK